MISTGHIAVLVTPASRKLMEELSEKRYDDKSILEINDEGTLLISDINLRLKYSEREFNGDLLVVGGLPEADRQEFIALAKAEGIDIDPDSIKPYTCIWYNGSDSPVSMMKKAAFLAK
jgi:hypothetical protein